MLLYIHVPFCRSICRYCDFPRASIGRDAPILNYLAVLHEEIRLVAVQAPHALPVSDLHFGGGTPTLTPPAEFLALMEILGRRFRAGMRSPSVDPRPSRSKWLKRSEQPGSTARAWVCSASVLSFKRPSTGSAKSESTVLRPDRGDGGGTTFL